MELDKNALLYITTALHINSRRVFEIEKRLVMPESSVTKVRETVDRCQQLLKATNCSLAQYCGLIVPLGAMATTLSL